MQHHLQRMVMRVDGANRRPRYETRTIQDQRGPVAVTLRVLHVGGVNATDEDRIAAMQVAMRQGILNAVRRIRPEWGPLQLLRTVHGFMSAENVVDGHQEISNSRVVRAMDVSVGMFMGIRF